MKVRIGYSSISTVNRSRGLSILRTNSLISFPKTFSLKEGDSACLRCLTTFSSYAASKKMCLLPWVMSVLPCWSTVSPVRFRRPSLHKFLISSHSALTPDSPFPTQLRQANAALTHLLSKGISPANIVVGGDSAGGNLILQLTSHILHPLPSIPALPALAQPLAGAMLISPACAFSADSPSYARNDGKDVIRTRSYAFLTDLVTPGLTPELEHYCQPLSAPATWWNGLDTVYARVLVTVGENECPFDHVIEMSSVISDHVQDTVTVVEPGAVHDEVIIKFGKDVLGKDYDVIVGFLSRSFQGGS